ncbi:PEP-CTERM sorting domain-containing protein, partial [Crocosphaera watsonii]
ALGNIHVTHGLSYYNTFRWTNHPRYPRNFPRSSNLRMYGMSEELFVPTAVPEPLTILGAGTAIAFGVGFKRKLGKAKKK